MGTVASNAQDCQGNSVQPRQGSAQSSPTVLPDAEEVIVVSRSQQLLTTWLAPAPLQVLGHCSEQGPPGACFPVVCQGLWHLVFHDHPVRQTEQPGLFGSILQLWIPRCSEILRILPKGTPSLRHIHKKPPHRLERWLWSQRPVPRTESWVGKGSTVGLHPLTSLRGN